MESLNSLNLPALNLTHDYAVENYLVRDGFAYESMLKGIGYRMRIPCDVHFNVLGRKAMTYEYILALTIFNSFLGLGGRNFLFRFRPMWTAKKSGSLVDFLSSARFYFRYWVEQPYGFFYFYFFFYLPRLMSLGENTGSFSQVAIFPNFEHYPEEFDRFSKKYPHYSPLFRRLGLVTFEERALLLTVPFSSYMFKNAYVSTIIDEDWSFKVNIYVEDRMYAANDVTYRSFRSFMKFPELSTQR